MEKMRVLGITVFLFIGAAIAKDAGIGLLSETEAYESPKLKKFITHCTSHVGETCSTTSSSGSEALMQTEGVLALCLFDSMQRCLVDQEAQLYQISFGQRGGGPVIPFPKRDRPPPKITPPNVVPLPVRPIPTIPSPPIAPGEDLSHLIQTIQFHDHQVLPFARKLKPLPPMQPLPPLIRPPPTIPSPPIAPEEDLSRLIQTIQLRTVLRTCTHVTARTCLTAPTSDLEACLTPSMNQCIYPRAAQSGIPPIRA